MIALIQRVTRASVTVADEVTVKSAQTFGAPGVEKG